MLVRFGLEHHRQWTRRAVAERFSRRPPMPHTEYTGGLQSAVRCTIDAVQACRSNALLCTMVHLVSTRAHPSPCSMADTLSALTVCPSVAFRYHNENTVDAISLMFARLQLNGASLMPTLRWCDTPILSARDDFVVE